MTTNTTQFNTITLRTEKREFCVVVKAGASTRVLEYYSSSKILESFFLLEYSLVSTSGCKFPFFGCIFLQSVDELLEFMEIWGSAISFATCQPEVDLNIQGGLKK